MGTKKLVNANCCLGVVDILVRAGEISTLFCDDDVRCFFGDCVYFWLIERDSVCDMMLISSEAVLLSVLI